MLKGKFQPEIRIILPESKNFNDLSMRAGSFHIAERLKPFFITISESIRDHLATMIASRADSGMDQNLSSFRMPERF
jgi:hypothetical protein